MLPISLRKFCQAMSDRVLRGCQLVTDAKNPGKRCLRAITISDRLELKGMRSIGKSVARFGGTSSTQSNSKQRNVSAWQEKQKVTGKTKTHTENQCHYNVKNSFNQPVVHCS